MADQLATPTDLANLVPGSSLPAATATLLLECATAVVQAAADGQRIVQVVNDVLTLAGTTDETELRDADAILICVPTPLAEHREPDLGAVRAATAAVVAVVRWRSK